MAGLAMLLRTVVGFQLGPCFKGILPVASVFAYFVSFAVVSFPGPADRCAVEFTTAKWAKETKRLN
jgi:hypothetical protein